MRSLKSQWWYSLSSHLTTHTHTHTLYALAHHALICRHSILIQWMHVHTHRFKYAHNNNSSHLRSEASVHKRDTHTHTHTHTHTSALPLALLESSPIQTYIKFRRCFNLQPELTEPLWGQDKHRDGAPTEGEEPEDRVGAQMGLKPAERGARESESGNVRWKRKRSGASGSRLSISVTRSYTLNTLGKLNIPE